MQRGDSKRATHNIEGVLLRYSAGQLIGMILPPSRADGGLI